MSKGTAAVQRVGRGRRPAAEVRSSILQAAAELLFSDGLGALTFERVAMRAGASKVTIYKWWPSPAVLAFDAYSADVEPALAPPDTGDMVHDVRVQIHAFVQLMMKPTPGGFTHGHIIAELIGAAQSDDHLGHAFRDLYTLPRRQIGINMFLLGQQRGQLTPEKDPSVLLDQLWGACYFRYMFFGEPLDTEYADTLIDNLFGTHTKP